MRGQRGGDSVRPSGAAPARALASAAQIKGEYDRRLAQRDGRPRSLRAVPVGCGGRGPESDGWRAWPQREVELVCPLHLEVRLHVRQSQKGAAMLQLIRAALTSGEPCATIRTTQASRAEGRQRARFARQVPALS